MKQQKENELALELEYKNGDVNHKFQPARSVVFSEESQLNLDLIFEEAEKVPSTIRNAAEATKVEAFLIKVNSAIRSVEALVFTEKEPVRKLSKQIDGAVSPSLAKLNELKRARVAGLTAWALLQREGGKNQAQKFAAKKAAAEREVQAEDNQGKKAELQTKIIAYEGEIKKAQEVTTPGLALEEYWEAELEDPVALLKSKHRHFLEVTVDQRAINTFCRHLEEGGAKIHAKLIPGLKLVKKSRGKFRG